MPSEKKRMEIAKRDDAAIDRIRKQNGERVCDQCGAVLKTYWLKDGVCNGCRNPHLIVKAQISRWIVEYTCPNSPFKAKRKEFDTENEACNWVDEFRLNYGPTWTITISKKGDL